MDLRQRKMADKKGRINSIITRNLCDIIMKEMQDPIVKLSSINEVKVNRDHSFAHVYVAHLQTEKTEELVNFLNKNKGFIRSRLAKSVDLYKIPDLIFVADTLYDQGAKIDNIINSWKKIKTIGLKAQ